MTCVQLALQHTSPRQPPPQRFAVGLALQPQPNVILDESNASGNQLKLFNCNCWWNALPLVTVQPWRPVTRSQVDVQSLHQWFHPEWMLHNDDQMHIPVLPLPTLLKTHTHTIQYIQSFITFCVSEWVGFNVSIKHIIGHFREQPFQLIICTDNLTRRPSKSYLTPPRWKGLGNGSTSVSHHITIRLRRVDENIDPAKLGGLARLSPI